MENIVTNRLIFLSLLFISISFLHNAYAIDSSQDLYKQVEIQNKEFQLQLEKSTLELKKMELERLKMDAEYKTQEAESARQNAESARLNAETEQLITLNTAANREKELKVQFEQVEQELQEHEKAIKEAEDTANEASRQIEQVDVRHSNQFYMSSLSLIFMIFVWSVVKKSKKEVDMKDYEKYGVLIILGSTLLIVLALMISEPWIDRYDFVQNLMAVLKISFFKEVDECTYSCTYRIEFSTKYAILALLTTTTYGFTTYLGITPAFKMDSLGLSSKTEDKVS